MLRAATLFIDGKQMSNSGMLRRGNATSPAASVSGDVPGIGATARQARIAARRGGKATSLPKNCSL
jgi:hypothetical protein